MKFFFGKSAEKIPVLLKIDKTNGAVREDRYTVLIISRSVLLGMRNVSDRSCKDKTHILFSVTLFFKNLAIDEIMWKNIVEPDRSQMTVWSLCIACWIPKDTNTLLEYVILIALLLQK